MNPSGNNALTSIFASECGSRQVVVPTTTSARFSPCLPSDHLDPHPSLTITRLINSFPSPSLSTSASAGNKRLEKNRVCRYPCVPYHTVSRNPETLWTQEQKNEHRMGPGGSRAAATATTIIKSAAIDLNSYIGWLAELLVGMHGVDAN